MALNKRQLRLYKHVVNIYVPININAQRIGTNDVQALVYPATPTYTGIKCYRKTIPRLSKGHFFGREKQDTTTANFEEVHFDLAQDISANYAFQVTGGPDTTDLNTWYIVSSESDSNSYRANVAAVLVKKTTKPPGVT